MQADTSMTWRRDLAWCSSSSAEIARATGVLDALRKQGVIDARGFVVLNGAFADRLYPGVITIITARQSGVAPTLRGHPRLPHLCRSRSSSRASPGDGRHGLITPGCDKSGGAPTSARTEATHCAK